MYLLTLFPYGFPGGGNQKMILIPNIEESTIIRGINQMINQDSNYYELYAKNPEMFINGGEPYGSYNDNVTLVKMCWETELMPILKD